MWRGLGGGVERVVGEGGRKGMCDFGVLAGLGLDGGFDCERGR